MAGIEIRGLSKFFRDKSRALEGIDLDVADGELLVLVGPSGSGKTTLLRLIAGLNQPTAGTIRLGENDLAGVPPHRRNVALVFQNLALYGHLRVADNLAFGQENQDKAEGGKRKADGGEDRVRQVTELLGIGHLLERYPAELSGGEQQRVALGRAIVRQPAALLLDEPLSSLDGPARRILRRELKRVQRQLGVPTIYVTHDQAEALALGDRIAVLDRGRLQQCGTPDAVYHHPANQFVAEFFGPQGMNLIEGELKDEDGQITFVARGVSFALPPELANRLPRSTERLLAGFRPEDATIVDAEGDAGCCVTGTVKSCEVVGDAAYVGVGLGAWWADVTIKLPGHREPPVVFDVVCLELCVERMHWFDPATGDRV